MYEFQTGDVNGEGQFRWEKYMNDEEVQVSLGEPPVYFTIGNLLIRRGIPVDLINRFITCFRFHSCRDPNDYISGWIPIEDTEFISAEEFQNLLDLVHIDFAH